MFNLNGSGREGACMECGEEVRGYNLIRRLRQKARLDYATERMNKIMVESMDDVDKLLRGKYAKTSPSNK